VVADVELVELSGIIELAVEEAAVLAVVDVAVVDAWVLEGAVVEAAFVALAFAVVWAVVLAFVVEESLESSVVALFFRSCLRSGIVHSCINHTASSFLQPPTTKHGDISSKLKVFTYSRIHFEIDSLSPQEILITSSSKSLFTQRVSIAETIVVVANRPSKEGRMLDEGNTIWIGIGALNWYYDHERNSWGCREILAGETGQKNQKQTNTSRRKRKGNTAYINANWISHPTFKCLF
jgi:hypothetical protein